MLRAIRRRASTHLLRQLAALRRQHLHGVAELVRAVKRDRLLAYLDASRPQFCSSGR